MSSYVYNRVQNLIKGVYVARGGCAYRSTRVTTTECVTMVDYGQWCEIHSQQLQQVPERYWNALFRKINSEVRHSIYMGEVTDGVGTSYSSRERESYCFKKILFFNIRHLMLASSSS